MIKQYYHHINLFFILQELKANFSDRTFCKHYSDLDIGISIKQLGIDKTNLSISINIGTSYSFHLKLFYFGQTPAQSWKRKRLASFWIIFHSFAPWLISVILLCLYMQKFSPPAAWVQIQIYDKSSGRRKVQK